MSSDGSNSVTDPPGERTECEACEEVERSGLLVGNTECHHALIARLRTENEWLRGDREELHDRLGDMLVVYARGRGPHTKKHINCGACAYIHAENTLGRQTEAELARRALDPKQEPKP